MRAHGIQINLVEDLKAFADKVQVVYKDEVGGFVRNRP
jgi:hypothetical protein